MTDRAREIETDTSHDDSESVTPTHGDKPASPRTYPRQVALAVAGVVLFLAGMAVALTTVHATESGMTVSCGSLWKPDMQEAETLTELSHGGDPFEQHCHDGREARALPGYGLMGLGIVSMLLIAVTPAPAIDDRRGATTDG